MDSQRNDVQVFERKFSNIELNVVKTATTTTTDEELPEVTTLCIQGAAVVDVALFGRQNLMTMTIHHNVSNVNTIWNIDAAAKTLFINGEILQSLEVSQFSEATVGLVPSATSHVIQFRCCVREILVRDGAQVKLLWNSMEWFPLNQLNLFTEEFAKLEVRFIADVPHKVLIFAKDASAITSFNITNHTCDVLSQNDSAVYLTNVHCFSFAMNVKDKSCIQLNNCVVDHPCI